MTSRPDFASIYMALAEKLSQRSTCKRLHVGTVITSTDHRKVLAVGYNGNATGLHNGCDREEAGNCGCLHSEENAVINCDAPRQLQKLVYVTHLPCVTCAKRLINLGNVQGVCYLNDYRIRDSLVLLAEAGIPTHQRQPPVDPHDALHLAARRVEHLESVIRTAVAQMEAATTHVDFAAIHEALQNEVGP